MIRVLAIARKDGVSYHRIEMPMKALKENYPEEFEVWTIENTNRDMRVLPDMHAYTFDIILFNTTLQIPKDSMLLVYIQMQLFKGAKLILDIDDHFKYGRSQLLSKETLELIEKGITKAVDATHFVSTTTEPYKEMLGRFGKEVFVFPNAIIDNKFDITKNKSDRIRVGLTSAGQHKYDIRLLRGMASMIKDAGIADKVELVLTGYHNHETYVGYEQDFTDNYKFIPRRLRKLYSNDLDNVDLHVPDAGYRRIGWVDVNSYINLYKDIDILLAPLEDNRFNSAKSQLKYIESGYTRTLFVGSNTITYSPYVQHGINGYLCKNAKEFADVIIHAVNNWDEQKAIIDNAEKDVAEKYVLSQVSKERARVFREVANTTVLRTKK